MSQNSIKSYYASGVEKDRLQKDYFKLEGIRTKEIISRYLQVDPLKILDVGGGIGFYAFWLKSLGHEVTLVDLSANNIAWAKEYAAEKNLFLDGYKVGDTGGLRFPDDQFDLVLLLGPLYHLTDRADRIKAIVEAKRVLKPNGLLIAAVISRYASLMDGFKRNLIADEQFVAILTHDLNTGIHINNTENFEYFTTAFFHTPDEIENEIRECNLNFEKIIAVESLGWLLDDVLRTSDTAHTELICSLIRQVEENKDLMASSPHILAIARKLN